MCEALLCLIDEYVAPVQGTRAISLRELLRVLGLSTTSLHLAGGVLSRFFLGFRKATQFRKATRYHFPVADQEPKASFLLGASALPMLAAWGVL